MRLESYWVLGLAIFGVWLMSLPSCAQNDAKGRIQGTVIDSTTGKPVPFQKIRLIPKDKPEIRRTETDQKGIFEYFKVAAGSYTISITDVDADKYAVMDDDSTVHQTIVVADESKPLEIEIRLKPAALVEGRVTYTDGTPISTRVTHFAKSGLTARTDPKTGEFKIRGLDAASNPTITLTTDLVDDRKIFIKVPIAPGKVTRGADIVYRRPDPAIVCARGTVSFRGKALSDLEDVFLMVTLEISHEGFHLFTLPNKMTGEFSIVDVDPGDYQVTATIGNKNQTFQRSFSVALKKGETSTLTIELSEADLVQKK